MSEVGISLVSYLPWSAFFPLKWAQIAEEDGFDFLQVLPFRGVDSEFIHQCPLPIRYAERAWNPTSLRRLMRSIVAKDPKGPKIHDFLFFPSPKQSTERFHLLAANEGVTVIVHNLGEFVYHSLLEVSPGLMFSPKGLASHIIDRGKVLVLDTYHLRRGLRVDESVLAQENLLGGWQGAIKILLSTTALIHVSPSRDFEEIEPFIQHHDSELEQMLRFIKHSGYDGDYVIEAIIGIRGLNPITLRKTMQKILERVKEILT